VFTLIAWSAGMRFLRDKRPRGGSLAARGKRVYSSCGSRREYFDATSFSNTQLLLEIWKELLKRSTSKCSPSPKTYEKILSYKIAVQVNLRYNRERLQRELIK